MPRVSVIIPTYNRAHLIGDAVSSVLAQTYSNFELLIIDDGSTDNTEAVVRTFEDPRVKYLKQENRGVSAARNRGIRESVGEFISFLDSDDIYPSKRLALQVEKLDEDPNAGLVYGRYYSITHEGAQRQLRGMCHDELDLERLLFGVAFHWSTVMVRHERLQKVGGFNEQLHVSEEWELTLKLALDGCPMICLPEPLAIVRQQPNSLGKSAYEHGLSLLTVLDEVFADPRLPPDLITLKERAYAARLIRIAASAYLSRKTEAGQRFLKRALEIDPTLIDSNISLLAQQLVRRIVGLGLGEAQEILRLTTEHLPGDKVVASRLKRQLWGEYYQISAFSAYRSGRMRACRSAIVRAARETPRCLFQDRGLLSIFLRSFLTQN